jgi:5'-nucleotidase
MGDDTVYSGTVAAATEGYLLGIPSLAVSLTSTRAAHFSTAAQVVLEFVKRVAQHGFSQPVLFNVNVPDVPYAELKGMEVTRLGKRHKAEGVIRAKNPRNETIYWIGAAGAAQDSGPGTDFHAIGAGKVSVTPLRVDLTDAAQIAVVQEWLAR